MTKELVERALAEDVGSGDITTQLCVPEDRMAVGRIIAREAMVIAGVEVLPLIFPNAELKVSNGDRLEKDDVIAVIRGPARELLTGERTALNFLQRLSGIATLADRYVRAVEGTKCRILDTRKTTPGLRALEKMAARAGDEPGAHPPPRAAIQDRDDVR